MADDVRNPLPTWQMLAEQVRERLDDVPVEVAAAFAVVTAERLMRADPLRRPYTLSLRPLLDLLWQAVCGDHTVHRAVAAALAEYYVSDYCHNDGQDGPDDADDDPAAAILYAAECWFHMVADFAVWVGDRGIAAADNWAYLATEADSDDDNDVEAVAEAAVVAEARLQLATLDALEPYVARLSGLHLGLSVDEIDRLSVELPALVDRLVTSGS